MEREKDLNFDELMLMKEKRRTSRTKGKRTYEKTKIRKPKSKHRNVKEIQYDPYVNEDDYDDYDDY